MKTNNCVVRPPQIIFLIDSFSEPETANPLVAEFEDDLSSCDEIPMVVQPKSLENLLSKPLNKQKETLVEPELDFINKHQVTKSDSSSSIEEELNMSRKLRLEPIEGHSDDTHDSWLGQDPKWRQSPEGGEDMGSNVGSKKDRFELSDKSLDASVTSSNVNLELLDSSGINQVSSDDGNYVVKEKKKQKDKVSNFGIIFSL